MVAALICRVRGHVPYRKVAQWYPSGPQTWRPCCKRCGRVLAGIAQ